MSIKMLNKLSFTVLLWILCLQGFGQKVSNKGREFWVGYGHHQYMENGTNTQNMVLYLSAESQPATVTITLDSSGFTSALWYRKTYNIPANTVIATEYLPKGTINAAASGTNPNFDSRLYTDPPPFGTGGEGIFRKKGIHIESNVDIVAYAHIFGSVSSGATVLLPVKSWGFAYTSINSEQVDAAGPAYTWAYVIAKDNNTRIKVTPSVTTRLGKPAGTAVTVDLQKGQIYQIIGQSDNSGNGNQFTGSKIESIVGADGQCHLIAAFSGSSRTRGESVPCGSGSGRDNDMQQMFAEQTWGKRYLTAPFSTASGSSANPTLNASSFMTHVYKIVIKEPNTVVKRNGTVLTGYNGLYYQFSSNTADYIEADKPIAIAQFMSGSSTCNPGSYGDPEMVFLTPIEQAIPKVSFYRNNVESIYANYVTLIVPTAGVASLKIDNSSVFNHSYVHPNLPGYTVVVKGWKAAPAQATIVCDSGFNAITYGLGSAESYAYIAGAFFENLNAISGLTNNPGLDTTNKLNTFNCVNTPVQLSVLIRYKPNDLTIQMDAVGNKVTPNAPVTLNPASNFYVDSVTVNGQGYYQYALPGTYLFNTAGTYTIPVIATRYATGLCIDREEIPLTVVIKPKATSDFSFVVSGCPSDSVKFTADTSGGGYTITKFAWEFPIGTPHADSSRVTGKIFPGPGNYNVKLTAFTKDACNADTVKTIVIGTGPTTTFSVAPSTVCEGQSITITPGTTSGATEWIWDFGDGNIDTLTNGNPFTHTYSTFGTYSIGHSINNGSSCKPSATPIVVNVNANPFATFTFPAGCLPTTGIVQFNSTAFAPDGKAITTHAWNFGDPGSGVNNTSTAASPTHNYALGNYTITYRAETANGCFKDTTVSTTFNVKPSVLFTALTALCDSSAPISIANGSVTNGVPGTGIYKGPGIIDPNVGIFDPAVAGVGTHTLWYVFTSTTGNCQDSQSQSITVKPLPKAGFSYPLGCQSNSTIAFTDTSKIPVGLTASYGWNFGEPLSGANNISTLQNPTHSYASGGSYIVNLILNLNGCSDTATTTVPLKVQPQLSYPVLPGVCGTLAPLSVASAIVTNAVPGAGIYKGTGITNSNGTFDPLIAGIGTHQIWFVFTATDGCIDSVSTTISVGPPPTASFTYPLNCLTNGNVQFTSNSTIPAGPAPVYTWDFGDPLSGANNISSAQNPIHSYLNDSVRIVKLTVSVSGCADDTTISVPVRIQPVISFSAQPDVCINIPAYTINLATITNGVGGNGKYVGIGITDTLTGTFNPSIAGVGPHTITYSFTSLSGCTATANATIIVKAIPFASFTFPTICLPNGNIQFTNTSTGASTYVWDFGDASATSTSTSPLHLYAGSGPFNVKLTSASNGCSKDTTIAVLVKVQPQISFPIQAGVCLNVPPFGIAQASVTNGVTGIGKYTGSGIIDTIVGTFNPAIAGVGSHNLTYNFVSALGCTATANATIVVKAIPFASFTFPTTCLPTANVQFTNTSIGASSYVWDFGDASATSTSTSPAHLYTGAGPFNVKLTSTSNGCSKDTTIAVLVKVQPQLSFPTQAGVCLNAPPFGIAQATITNGVTGTGKYTGPGITDTIVGTFNPAIAGVGTHNITYSFVSALGCATSAASSIVVKSVPVASFTYPTGCLPNGLVQFNNNSTGSIGGTYLWNFGDPGSGVNNTSTFTNPQHSYSTFGSYSIKLTATLNGCSDDTTITTTFALQPILSYPRLPSVCAGSAPVSVASAFVTNGVLGAGTYAGTGVDASGIFSPIIAGVGTHLITYSFISTIGSCASTVSRSIVVNPIPLAAFSITDSICENTSSVISNSSTISRGAIVTWLWNINGRDSTRTTGLPFSINFPSLGSQVVTLKVVSDSGCLSAGVNKTIHVGPIPTAAFVSPLEICMPNGKVDFVDASTIADNTPLEYAWNFGDGSPINNSSNPQHTFNIGGDTVFVKLTVTSVFGCINSDTNAIVFRKKPYVNFIPQFDTLCQGQQVIFFALSNPPAESTISSYTWDFGDGGPTSKDTNAVKVFNNYGDYSIKLTVTTNNGCIGDTSKVIRVNLQPKIDAGYSVYAHLNELVTFNPVINSPNVSFNWSPSTGLNSTSAIRPSLKATATQTYTLTATAPGGCTAMDSLTVFLMNQLVVPNAFSPNGDGINDLWEITNLGDYPKNTVNVYNRYGRLVYRSSGLNRAWNGKSGGKDLPVGTYYYVINLDDESKPIVGYVVILK